MNMSIRKRTRWLAGATTTCASAPPERKMAEFHSALSQLSPEEQVFQLAFMGLHRDCLAATTEHSLDIEKIPVKKLWGALTLPQLAAVFAALGTFLLVGWEASAWYADVTSKTTQLKRERERREKQAPVSVDAGIERASETHP